MAVVIKPFDFASDGFTIESLVTGDEREFGAATAGLVEEKFISIDADAEFEPEIEPEIEPEPIPEPQPEPEPAPATEPEVAAEPEVAPDDLLVEPAAPTPKKRGK